ncbi:MAG: TatD family hydrolase [Myxococcales bacterium]|nr:TatD family hydrolase [Myxococcales bacterium]
MTSGFFDSHTHLDEEVFGDELGDVIGRAHGAGVKWMVTIGAGATLDTSRRAVELAQREETVWATVGIHPHHADLVSDTAIEELTALAKRPKVVALGEMGLDFHYDFQPVELQRDAFARQIELARELDLPVVIHSRSAERECLDLLCAGGPPKRRGIFHCYTGDVATAEAILARDFWISIPGIVTFKKAAEMHALVEALPLERLLIETDAPYLAPHPHRGKRNEPALIVHTATKIAEIKNASLDEVAQVTACNAWQAYFFDRHHHGSPNVS